jgi:peptidoglycan/xylan/chitin deacetylase (PgdA/CDA1 family)
LKRTRNTDDPQGYVAISIRNIENIRDMAERGKDDTQDGSSLRHPLFGPEDRLTRRSARGLNIKLQAVILLGLALVTATFAEARLQIDGASVPILIFHSVRPYWPTDLKRARRYIVTPYTFDRELGYLKENGYVSVSFDDLAHRLSFGTPLPPKPLIISFDDGWASQYQYALPLLKKYGFIATFFIFTNAIGVKNFMSWDQVLALKEADMQIGCHSKSHPALTRIKSEEALREEIFGAKQIIETHLRKTVTAYDYPFGLYNDHIIDLVKEAGFVCARGTAPGIIHTRD